MVNVKTVSETLKTIGLISDSDIPKIMPFCESVCREISERLKEKAYATEPAVTMACAFIAYYRYTLSAGIGFEDFSSFKAGDVTITKSASASAENAAKLRDEALASAASFLTDIDFAFQAVIV